MEWFIFGLGYALVWAVISYWAWATGTNEPITVVPPEVVNPWPKAPKKYKRYHNRQAATKKA